MPKFWNWSNWIVFLVIIVWATSASAQGVEYQIGGFIQNQSATRFKNGVTGENWTFPLVRNTLQLEGLLQFNPNLRLVGIYRGAYDASFALDDRLNQFPKKELDLENDLREIYADVILKNFSLRLGRQQVVWGESDGLRLADIINPLDLRWHYFLESFEDIRRPIWLARGTFFMPKLHELSLEVAYIPFEFLPAKVAPFGGNWAFPAEPNSPTVTIDDRTPGNSLENGEIGSKAKLILSGWEVSLFGFHTRSDVPVALVDSLTFAPVFMVHLGLEYYRQNVFGATFNKYSDFAKTVFRGEFTCTANQAYNTSTPNLIKKKPTINYVLGFDRPTMLFINPSRSVLLSGQFFQSIVLEHDTSLVLTGYSTKQKKVTTLASLYTNTGYFHDRLLPEFLGIYDFRGQGWLQPKLSYVYNDYWKITLGANLLFGNNAFEGPFGFFQENDEMFLQIRFGL